MSYSDKQALNAKREEREFSQSPAAQRGNQQDIDVGPNRGEVPVSFAPDTDDSPKERSAGSFGGSLNGRDKSGWPEGV